jgi:hypothetical protein
LAQLDPSQGELTPVTVEQFAWRIVELLSNHTVDAVVDALTHAPDPPMRRLVDAATIAQRCGVERRFAYDHQRELRAIRLGHGPKPACASTYATSRLADAAPRRSEDPGMADIRGADEESREARRRRQPMSSSLCGSDDLVGSAIGESHMRFLGIDLDLLTPAERRDLANALLRAAWSAALKDTRILLIDLLLEVDEAALGGAA